MSQREDEQQEQQPEAEPQAQPEQDEPTEADEREGESHDGGAEQPQTGRRPDFIAEQSVEVTEESGSD